MIMNITRTSIFSMTYEWIGWFAVFRFTQLLSSIITHTIKSIHCIIIINIKGFIDYNDDFSQFIKNNPKKNINFKFPLNVILVL
jgi:hypothetical protein